MIRFRLPTSFPNMALYLCQIVLARGTRLANVHQANRVPPVSYTHLDVYKRQHYGNTTSDEFNGESSGKLKYVRIEFAGYPLEPDKEINGLTFGGVGSGTEVEFVQVSYSNDDSYEWFGGCLLYTSRCV